jgi:hypothetical protein
VSNKLRLIQDQKHTADKAYNYIGTGGPAIEVQGQGAVLAEKKRKSKAY